MRGGHAPRQPALAGIGEELIGLGPRLTPESLTPLVDRAGHSQSLAHLWAFPRGIWVVSRTLGNERVYLIIPEQGSKRTHATSAQRQMTTLRCRLVRRAAALRARGPGTSRCACR
jgi:hypothetical protein